MMLHIIDLNVLSEGLPKECKGMFRTTRGAMDRPRGDNRQMTTRGSFNGPFRDLYKLIKVRK